jgi:hypothetical protein
MEFEEDEEKWQDIRVVWYDDKGIPFKYEDHAAAVHTEECTLKALKSELWAFNAALHKPVLRPSDFPDYESEYSVDGDAL